MTERRAGSERERWGVSLAVRGVAAAVLAVGFLVGWLALPLRDWLEAFIDWINGLGWSGYFVFALVFVLASLLLAPGALLTLAAGLSFGWGSGLAVVVAGALLSATLAFLSARYAFRRPVFRLMQARPRLKALDRAVSRQGWKAVLLLRLSGLLPFNLQSYLFGATGVGFWPYLAATLLGVMPGATLFSYLGATMGRLAEESVHGPGQAIVFGIGLAAMLGGALVVARAAKRSLAVRT